MTALATGSSIGRATRRMASRARRGSDSQASTHSARTRAPSGVVGHAVDGRPDEGEPRVVRPARRSAKPRSTPSMSFRWSQRETCTTRGAPGENGPAPPRTAGDRSVRCALEQADPRQERQDLRRAQGTVLGGQRVDGGLDDPHVGPGQPGRHEGRVGEDEGPAFGQVGLQEFPRLLGERVGVVRSDVAAPGRAHAVLNEVVRHACRLRVVQEDDVVAADAAVQGLHVGPEDGRVVLGLARSEVPGVAGARRAAGCAGAW